MYNSFSLFEKNIEQTKELSSLYQYLESTITSPLSFDDILRSKIVYSVSAFDKLMHDLIRIGIVDTFAGNRSPTPKYLSDPITLNLHNQLVAATIPPKEFYFEQAIFNKLKVISYQDPSKISDGLSYIWDEKQKWKKIAEGMTRPEDSVKTKLKLIASRRNTIVHEADIDPLTNKKYSINVADCESTTDFLYACGKEIYNKVSG